MSFFDIDFKIQGNPIALKRHRSFQKGEFRGTYDPSSDDKANFLTKAISYKPEIPFDEPLYVKFTFCFSRPKNHYKTGKNAHILKDNAPKWRTSTPDVDNLEKFVGDALNGIFWKDDSKIVDMSGSKPYGEQPYIQVQVARLNKFNKS